MKEVKELVYPSAPHSISCHGTRQGNLVPDKHIKKVNATMLKSLKSDNVHIVDSEEDDSTEATESDEESLEYFDTETAAKDYHLGKLFVRFAQTLELMTSGRPDASPAAIDALIETQLIGYDYGKAFGCLSSGIESVSSLSLARNTINNYEAFHCAVGVILRTCDLDERTILEKVCQHHNGSFQTNEEFLSQLVARQKIKQKSARYEQGSEDSERLEQYNKAVDGYNFRSDPEDMIDINKMPPGPGQLLYKTEMVLRGYSSIGEGLTAFEARGNAAAKICGKFPDIMGSPVHDSLT